PAAPPLAHLADRSFQHPTGEVARIARSLRERHELCGRYAPELRMSPAHQRIETLHGLRGHGHFRLIDEREAVCGDRGLQICDQCEAAAMHFVAARAVRCDTTA